MALQSNMLEKKIQVRIWCKLPDLLSIQKSQLNFMFMFGDEKIKNFYLSIFRRMEIKMKMNKKMLFLLYSNKKAYFFSLDAFIALVIILGVVLVVKPTIQNESPQINLQEDLVEVLSNLKIGEIDNPYAQQLISDGKIVNLNQSVLEQIGEFYAK